jgi:hypothetical protein
MGWQAHAQRPAPEGLVGILFFLSVELMFLFPLLITKRVMQKRIIHDVTAWCCLGRNISHGILLNCLSIGYTSYTPLRQKRTTRKEKNINKTRSEARKPIDAPAKLHRHAYLLRSTL